MPLKMRLRLLARGLPKLIAAIVIAGVVGVGLGVALSMVAGDDDGGGLADSGGPADTATTRAEQDTKPKKTKTTSPKQTTSPKAAPATNVRVEIVSADLLLARSESGRSRNRARASLYVRVTNRGNEQIRLGLPPVLFAKTQLRPDPASRERMGTLLAPVAPGKTAAGRLRFEPAGADTAQLRSTLRARLRLGGRTVAVKFKLAEPSV